jgi:hypothetical protein
MSDVDQIITNIRHWEAGRYDPVFGDEVELVALLGALADEIERLRAALAVKDNHDHFDCAAAMAKKDIEIKQLRAAIRHFYLYASRSELEDRPDWVQDIVDDCVP